MSPPSRQEQPSLSLLAAAFDALPAQVAVLDETGTIQATNRAWREFGADGGLLETETVGQNYLAVCDAADDSVAKAAAAGIRSVLDGDREEFSLEYPCEAPEGRRWFTMRVIEVPGSEAESRVLVMHTEITERKEAELGVQAHNETLETVAGVLSHDLRNPLNVAMARARHLQEQPDAGPDAVSEHTASMTASLQRMADIIDDAVVLARETDPDSVEAVDLAGVAEAAWSNVVTDGARLDVGESATVEADASLLTQLFENLFDNSVAHAGGGDAATTVTVTTTEAGFAVADDGRGVPAGEREQVFEMGYTTDADGGGTGMGLAIVRRIADAHGWDVSLAESADGGARFAFEGVTRS